MSIQSVFCSLLASVFLLFLNACSANFSRSYANGTENIFINPQGNFDKNASFSQAQKKEPKIAVILLHGLGMDNQQFECIEQALRNKYGRKIVIIKPTYREKSFIGVPYSIFFPLSHSWIPDPLNFLSKFYFPTQLDKVSKEIEAQLKDNNMQIEKDLVIVMGISQGGPLAAMVAKELNLGGMISINGALGGVYFLDNTNRQDLHKFLADAKPGLEKIGFGQKEINRILSQSNIQLSLSKTLPGIASIGQRTSCTRKVTKFITRGTTPFLLIGSYVKDIFSNIDSNAHNGSYRALPPKSPYAENLERSFAELITGNVYGLHDGLISTKNQLLIEDSQVNKMKKGVLVQDPKNTNLYRLCLEGVAHASHIVPIVSSPGISIDTSKIQVIEEARETAKHTIDFIDKLIEDKQCSQVG